MVYWPGFRLSRLRNEKTAAKSGIITALRFYTMKRSDMVYWPCFRLSRLRDEKTAAKSGIITASRLLYPKQKESATAGAALLGDYLPLRLELRFSPNARESEILLSLACMKCLSLSSKERSLVFCNVLRTGAGTACRGR